MAGSNNNPVLGGPDRYFDPAAFALPAAGFYGNLGRNTLTGPGLAVVDLSVNKRFRLSERFDLQFRTEFFNALNTPSFGMPVSGVSNAAFGVVNTQANRPRSIQFAAKLIW